MKKLCFLSILMTLFALAASIPIFAQENIDMDLSDALFEAISKGDCKAAGVIINRKQEIIEMGDINSISPLEFALMKNDRKMVQLLISKGAKINIGNFRGDTPLHKAVYFSSDEIVSFLISRGADVNNRNSVGMTPMFYARSLKAVKMLVKEGATINIKDVFGRTPLFDARNGKIAEYFISKGLKVNDMDNGNCSPLHYRVITVDESHNHSEIFYHIGDLFPPDDICVVRVLIGKGAEVNLKDNEGKTPLHKVDDKKIAELLIQKGSDVDVRDNDGRTPLHTAANDGIADVLIDRGADINAKDSGGNTPLHYMTNHGNADEVKLLISKGADIHITNNDGKTPLDYSCNVIFWGYGNPEGCILALLSHGACPSIFTLIELIKEKNERSLKLLFLHSPILWAKILIPLFLLILLVKIAVSGRFKKKES